MDAFVGKSSYGLSMRSQACFGFLIFSLVLSLGATGCASSSSPAAPTGGGTTGACGLATYGADAERIAAGGVELYKTTDLGGASAMAWMNRFASDNGAAAATGVRQMATSLYDHAGLGGNQAAEYANFFGKSFGAEAPLVTGTARQLYNFTDLAGSSAADWANALAKHHGPSAAEGVASLGVKLYDGAGMSGSDALTWADSLATRHGLDGARAITGDGLAIYKLTDMSGNTALRTAEDLIDALGQWAGTRREMDLPAPGVGIGIQVGTVTCGAIGDEGRLEYAVIGDPVNRAAKLQNHTKAEKVLALTTPYAVETAVAQGYRDRRAREVRSACSVAGIEEPLDVVVIA